MIDKSFIEKIISLAPATPLEIEGRQYVSGAVAPVKDPVPEKLCIHTLTGLVDYYDQMTEADQSYALFHVRDHENVALVSSLFGDFEQRKVYVSATAFELQHRLNRHMPAEEFIIYLQSMFVQDETTAKIMRIVGNLTQGTEMNVSDDGVTQRVTAKAGVARVEVVDLPNPVTLRPFRTFMDIAQPASLFVLRIKADKDNGPICALYEADGGSWKIDAIATIKTYLEDRKLVGKIIA